MNLIAQETCQSYLTTTIRLSRGLFAIVDVADYVWLSQWKWFADTGHIYTSYAVRREQINGRLHTILMHRELLNLAYGDKRLADHIDGNGLNNTRRNLRIATRSQNACNSDMRTDNTSGFKGVNLSYGKWRAYITKDQKQISLGAFSTKEEAYEAYCEAAKRIHGEFTRVG